MHLCFSIFVIHVIAFFLKQNRKCFFCLYLLCLVNTDCSLTPTTKTLFELCTSYASLFDVLSTCLICMSLWIKGSAKWVTCNVMEYESHGNLQVSMWPEWFNKSAETNKRCFFRLHSDPSTLIENQQLSTLGPVAWTSIKTSLSLKLS